LLRFPGLPLRERVRAALTARQFGALDPDDPALDGVGLGDWLRARGESERAIDSLWDLLIRPTLNLAARDASLALAARVLRTGFLERADAADIGWPAVPFSALHAEPAAAALRALGVRIETGARVDALECDAREPALWSRGARLTADAIVLATTHDEAARLLGGRGESGPLARLETSPIVNLHVVFDRRVMPHPLLAALDSPLQWLFDRTASAGVERGQYLTASLSAADRWLSESNASLRATFLPALAALLPAAREAEVLRFAVTCEPAATFRAAPGTRRLRPRPGCEIGGVFLAGVYTDTGWPATMEGAVRSGLAAADAALDACARRGWPGAKEAA
jgi:squalene-associated FAD-dependent desaturase